MRVAVDALAVSNFSGRVVLLGHLRNLAREGRGRHSFHVLHHAGNRDLRCDLGDNVEWIECGSSPKWTRRLAWQALRLGPTLERLRADVLLSTSGALSPGSRVPQLVLAQNPWCFFPEFHRTMGDRTKAALQRIGYRRAQARAEAIFYLSEHLATAYGRNAGRPPRHGETLYVGVDGGALANVYERPSFGERELSIVTVSVMARHKRVEDVVEALRRLHAQALPAKLRLVGPWPDAAYRHEMEALVGAAGLAGAVTITGGVSDAELAGEYRRARAFCLLSRCESFGIPAVEAQLFGTPCVVSDSSAAPEIAGPGGFVVADGDVAGAAAALAKLLRDEATWNERSHAACENVERFRWSRVSRPLLDYLDARQARA